MSDYWFEPFQCPACRGEGAIRGPEIGMRYHECRYCVGYGEVSEDEAAAWFEGDRTQSDRVQQLAELSTSQPHPGGPDE